MTSNYNMLLVKIVTVSPDTKSKNVTNQNCHTVSPAQWNQMGWNNGAGINFQSNF